MKILQTYLVIIVIVVIAVVLAAPFLDEHNSQMKNEIEWVE